MNQFNNTALAALSLTGIAFGHSSATTADVNHWDGSRADGHAPIGVTVDHTHNIGEWMLSYRFMNMHMEDLYNGDSKVSAGSTKYTMAPIEMDMQMHMFGTMFAPTNELTLMAMTHYVESSMEMLSTKGMMAGKKSDMESNGWGDSSIGGLYKIYDDKKSRAHVGLLLSVPTGSTSETFVTTMGKLRHQPFGMQLGTGTFDLQPSATYLHQPNAHFSYGAQLKGRLHLGRNDQGYSRGDTIEATSWVAHNLSDWASLSFRLAAKHSGSVDGDTDNSVNQGMMATMSPGADPENTGGTSIDAAVGLNFWHPEDGFRVATELSVPLYQNLNGTQLGQSWTLTLGTQYSW